MTTTPSLSAALGAVELLQREGERLTEQDRGTLAAARRHGDDDLRARVDAVEMIEARRAKRAKRRTAGDDR